MLIITLIVVITLYAKTRSRYIGLRQIATDARKPVLKTGLGTALRDIVSINSNQDV